MSRISQLQSFIQKLTGSLSLLELHELAKKLDKEIIGFPNEIESWPEDEMKLANKLVKDAFYKKLSVYKAYKYDWEAGRVLPSDEELKYLKKYVKDFSFIIQFFDEEIKQSPSLTDDFEWAKNDASEVKEALEELIKNDEYRRKAEEKLREENKEKGGGSSSSQLSDVDKQIASFQGKIQVLEDKLKQIPASDNSDASQQQKKEVQQQIQQLKKELENLKNGKNDGKNDFPTGLVISGGIAIIIILLVVVVFLLRKNNKLKK